MEVMCWVYLFEDKAIVPQYVLSSSANSGDAQSQLYGTEQLTGKILHFHCHEAHENLHLMYEF